jgi:hypothetical protein
MVVLVTALIIGVLPVIPVGEVLAPERSVTADLLSDPGPVTRSVSPLADATTLQKLRHLFSR